MFTLDPGVVVILDFLWGKFANLNYRILKLYFAILISHLLPLGLKTLTSRPKPIEALIYGHVPLRATKVGYRECSDGHHGDDCVNEQNLRDHFGPLEARAFVRSRFRRRLCCCLRLLQYRRLACGGVPAPAPVPRHPLNLGSPLLASRRRVPIMHALGELLLERPGLPHAPDVLRADGRLAALTDDGVGGVQELPRVQAPSYS